MIIKMFSCKAVAKEMIIFGLFKKIACEMVNYCDFVYFFEKNKTQIPTNEN